MPKKLRWLRSPTGSQAEADDELERLYPCSHGGVGGDRLSMAVEKGAKTAVVWLLFTLPLSLLEGVFSQNGPQRSRARRCCAAKRTLHGEDRSEILDKREKGGPKWTAKMAQSLTASDTLETHQTICPSLGVHTN